jgi:hypothetical protein
MLDRSLTLIQTKGNNLLSRDGLQSGGSPMKMSDEMAYFYDNAKRFRTRKRAPDDAFDEPPQEFVGAIGNLYGRKQLSPVPAATKDAAARQGELALPRIEEQDEFSTRHAAERGRIGRPW